MKKPRIVKLSLHIPCAPSMRGLISSLLSLTLVACPAVCQSIAPCADRSGACQQLQCAAEQECEATLHCCAAVDCCEETPDGSEPRPELPLERCCANGNCLCGGALSAKVGIELHSLSEILPDAVTLTADAGIRSNQQLAADYLRISAVSDDGTSIGRALRLRIESLLI
jgi:hypothetical protein